MKAQKDAQSSAWLVWLLPEKVCRAWLHSSLPTKGVFRGPHNLCGDMAIYPNINKIFSLKCDIHYAFTFQPWNFCFKCKLLLFA